MNLPAKISSVVGKGELVTVPEPERYEARYAYNDGYGYHNSARVQTRTEYLTPYYNVDWVKLTHQLKITFPFEKVITRDMGTSKCTSCGATYSGSQSMCDKQVRKIKFGKASDSWGDKWMVSENHMIGSVFTTKDYYNTTQHTVKEIKNEECMGSCSWDLSDVFHKQERFVRVVETASHLMTTSVNEIVEWQHIFHPDVYKQLKDHMTESRLIRLEAENEAVKNAIKMIAEKMNNAGAALSFGF